MCGGAFLWRGIAGLPSIGDFFYLLPDKKIWQSRNPAIHIRKIKDLGIHRRNPQAILGNPHRYSMGSVRRARRRFFLFLFLKRGGGAGTADRCPLCPHRPLILAPAPDRQNARSCPVLPSPRPSPSPRAQTPKKGPAARPRAHACEPTRPSPISPAITGRSRRKRPRDTIPKQGGNEELRGGCG